METKQLVGTITWRDFKNHLEKIDQETQELKKQKTGFSVTPVLYRGQADFNWLLESTLEREKPGVSVGEYFNMMLKVFDNLDMSLQQKWPELKNEIEELNCTDIHMFTTERANSRQIISFMAYLRHHGFPSPLLDWTSCPYIAAFFAFERIDENANYVAIYTFREQTGEIDCNLKEASKPAAIEIGTNIEEPSIRHKNQKAHYTLCVQQEKITDFKSAEFISLEADINKAAIYIDQNGADIKGDPINNVVSKYIIPASERHNVMQELYAQNICRCHLFDKTEENLLADLWNLFLINGEIYRDCWLSG